MINRWQMIMMNDPVCAEVLGIPQAEWRVSEGVGRTYRNQSFVFCKRIALFTAVLYSHEHLLIFE